LPSWQVEASRPLARNEEYDRPAIWLFLTQDPIGLAGGVNLYAYAGNDPITYDDPFGLCDQQDKDVCAAAGDAKNESRVREQDQQDLRAKQYGLAFREANDMIFGALFGLSQGADGDGGAAEEDAAEAMELSEEAAAAPALKAEAAAPLEAGPLPGSQYTEKVIGQLGSDLYHGFPKTIDGFAADQLPAKITGADGVTRTKISVPGSINGKSGDFTWIFEKNGDINHRAFEPH